MSFNINTIIMIISCPSASDYVFNYVHFFDVDSNLVLQTIQEEWNGEWKTYTWNLNFDINTMDGNRSRSAVHNLYRN